jgi:ubiquitin-associated SH3 domain-containing protein
MSVQFIVYACPTGELADQIATYFEKSAAQCGFNAAHQYMPHCTLTGFFWEQPKTAPRYVQTLERAYKLLARSRPHPAITVNKLTFRPDWHGLELEAPWLQKLMTYFTCTADSPSRKEPIRLKSWLHLSLAYDFSPEQESDLRELAETLVDPGAPVEWDLRFYQRQQNRWICHTKLPLN